MLRMFVVAVVAFVSIGTSREARADADPVATKDAMHDYFAGEKTGGYILVGLGVGGLATGALLYKTSQSGTTARGFSYPLLGLGLAHVVAGIFVTVSSVKRIDKFDAQIDKDAPAFVREEQPRMAGVSTQFFVLKIVETVIAAGGIGMAVYGAKTDRPRLKGAGLALALEMAATFAFDVVAARRAHDYRDKLAAQDAGAAPVSILEVGDAPRMILSTAIAF